MLKLSWKPYLLQLKRAFKISRGVRSNAPLMLIRISYEGCEGLGEASMPALYGESFESAAAFLLKIDLAAFQTPFETDAILQYIDRIAPGNQAIKAGIDIALHDLIGKLLQLPVHQYFGLSSAVLQTSMTIGIDTPEEMSRRAAAYAAFGYLKIKLGTENDRAIIRSLRATTAQPFFIDANQGWKNRELALEMIHWLKEEGAVFVEQPLPREQQDDQAWLREHSPLPVVGDEAVQRFSDLKKAAELYHGINIKLMKCTGLREGFKMAVAAKAMGLKVMLGCMSETSCAISAAAQLGALADWIDLDGNLEAVNDPYRGAYIHEGKLHGTGRPGIGLEQDRWNDIESYAI